MSALARWRKKVIEKGLTKSEKDKDLRKSKNKEAFKEFKAKRAEQQRKRRHRAKKKSLKKDSKKKKKQEKKIKNNKKERCVQFIFRKKGVRVFYVDLSFFKKFKNIEIKNRIYRDKSSDRLMKKIKKEVEKSKKSKKHGCAFETLSKKKIACTHDSGGAKVVYAVILSNF